MVFLGEIFRITFKIFTIIQYLACLSSSSSNDKLAFDVGLQEQSEGKLPSSLNSSGSLNKFKFIFDIWTRLKALNSLLQSNIAK